MRGKIALILYVAGCLFLLTGINCGGGGSNSSSLPDSLFFAQVIDCTYTAKGTCCDTHALATYHLSSIVFPDSTGIPSQIVFVK